MGARERIRIYGVANKRETHAVKVNQLNVLNLVEDPTNNARIAGQIIGEPNH